MSRRCARRLSHWPGTWGSAPTLRRHPAPGPLHGRATGCWRPGHSPRPSASRRPRGPRRQRRWRDNLPAAARPGGSARACPCSRRSASRSRAAGGRPRSVGRGRALRPNRSAAVPSRRRLTRHHPSTASWTSPPRSGYSPPTGPASLRAASRGQTDALAIAESFAVASAVVKGVGAAHKTDLDGVRLGLRPPEAIADAARDLLARFDAVLVEELVEGVVAELLVSVDLDPTFGPVLTLGWGGTRTELHADTCRLVLPAPRAQLRGALLRLPVHPCSPATAAGPPEISTPRWRPPRRSSPPPRAARPDRSRSIRSSSPRPPPGSPTPSSSTSDPPPDRHVADLTDDAPPTARRRDAT